MLPARFPNLLVNGSQGIAVGMATNIPPHNLGEVIDATIHLIDNPEATPDDLMAVRARAPTSRPAALILGRAGIIDAYRTGRGSIRMRAARRDRGGHGAATASSSPSCRTRSSSRPSPAKIKELVDDRRARRHRRRQRRVGRRQDTKLVIELKRDANANVVLNNLYKHTPLQTNFAVNMVALVDGVPRTLNLRAGAAGLRRPPGRGHHPPLASSASTRPSDRAHIVEGLLKALDVIDEIIAAIRASRRPRPRPAPRSWPSRSSSPRCRPSTSSTCSSAGSPGSAASTSRPRWPSCARPSPSSRRSSATRPGCGTVIKDELRPRSRTKFATPRRAEITYDPGDIDIEDLIDDEDLVVTMTPRATSRPSPADAFRTQGRGGRGVAGAKLQDEDYVTTSSSPRPRTPTCCSSPTGAGSTACKAHEIPMKERTARGTRDRQPAAAAARARRIQAIIDTRDYETNRFLFFATKQGPGQEDQVHRVRLVAAGRAHRHQPARRRRAGARSSRPTAATTSSWSAASGMTIRFTEDDVRPMGRAAAGVRGMKLKAGDEVVSLRRRPRRRGDPDRHRRRLRQAHPARALQPPGPRRPGRARHQAHRPARATWSRRSWSALDDEIFVIASGGTVIRMPVREISSQGRDATGVRVMNLDDGQTVAAVAPVLTPDDE